MPGISHISTLQLEQGLTRSGSVTAQLFRAVIHCLGGCTLPLCIYHFVFILPLQLQASRSLLVLLKPFLAGEGSIELALTQESCGRPGRLWVGGCSRPGTHAGPRDLIVLKYSPYHLIFQCPLQVLVSNSHILGYCWLFAVLLRRSARCFTCVQGKVDSAPTYLTAIF